MFFINFICFVFYLKIIFIRYFILINFEFILRVDLLVFLCETDNVLILDNFYLQYFVTLWWFCDIYQCCCFEYYEFFILILTREFILMRNFSLLLIVAAAIIFYFSIKFGFDLKTAIYTLFFIIIWTVCVYFLYRIYQDTGYAKIWFYLTFGIFLSFCFYPLLEFYSLKTEGYDVLDWAGLREKSFRLGLQQQLWFGVWYGKLAVTAIFAAIAVAIQQLFDTD